MNAMRVAMFYHSLLSDWNHGNAHFLRGVATELKARGHRVRIYEPKGSWSLTNLLSEYGEKPLHDFREAYPGLDSVRYETGSLDLGRELEGVDLALVHEWNDHELVRRIGEYRAQSSRLRVLFHDTHHRSVTDAEAMAAYELSRYDGVLAFGRVLRDLYLERGWAARAWTWHEAADTRVFRPLYDFRTEGDVVWVGNWGDDERTRELREFFVDPVRDLRVRARVYGVRYPPGARSALAEAGVEYRGWLPNFKVPEVFGSFRATVHIPRRPYTERLAGVPTIRLFEALACGIPVVCAPWRDAEGLFTPGKDFLTARDGNEMRHHLRTLLEEPKTARELAVHGRRTILARHTCAHRVDELLDIYGEITGEQLRGATA
jgi:spore maturation protein CgeB